MSKVPGTYTRTRMTRGLGQLQAVQVPGPAASLPGQHRAYRSSSGCGIIVGLEPAKAAPEGIWLPEGALDLWHLSISHPERYPTWDELADARYTLVPDQLTMAMLLPPRDEYLNVHEHCFHLWQIEDRRVTYP
jgi:hypothetical protein